MKHSLTRLPFSLLVLFATALPAHAATIALSPTSVSVAPGDTVSVTIAVDPAGKTLTAVKADLSYPENLLTPTSFTFAPKWIPLTQNGYDQMTGGTIVKSAGYPGGVTASTTFGTLVFTAKAAGTATVAVQQASTAYDKNGMDALSGAQGMAVITVAVVTTPPTSGTTSAATSTHVRTAPAHTVSTSPVRTNRTVASASGASATQPAAVAAAATSSTSTTGTPPLAAAASASGTNWFSSVWVWILLILLLGGVSFGLYWRRRKREA